MIRYALVALPILLVSAGCTDPFGLAPTHNIEGEFAAGPDWQAAPSAEIGTCWASIDGTRYGTTDAASSFEYKPVGIGPNDRTGLWVDCPFGRAYGSGWMVLTFPGRTSNAPPEPGTYRVIAPGGGGWERTPNPRVVWAIADVPTLRGRFLSSRSGAVEITHADARVVKGTFRMATKSERNP